MRFIDTHSHNYDEIYSQDIEKVIQRAVDSGVSDILQADIDSNEREAMFKLVERFPKNLHAMLGLYPGSVERNWEREIVQLYEYLDREIIAIGEIGLDYHFTREFENEQKKALAVQFELAAKLNLPVNIHLRDANEDFFKILNQYKYLGLRGNLHAFGGSFETFERIQKYGEWYVGIGGIVTFKNASISETIKKIPLENILLETDSPYLTPTPYRGQRNESAYIKIIAMKIAEQKQISVEEVADVTTKNAISLFGI